MNAIIRFLQAARSLKNSGITKEQVLEFAKREFGEVSAFFAPSLTIGITAPSFLPGLPTTRFFIFSKTF